MDCTDELKIFDDKLIKELSQIASDKIQYWDLRLPHKYVLDRPTQKQV